MLNWPIFGNDTYLNVIQLSDSLRQVELEKARQTTLRFVYFIQHELGFKNLGLADDEFPTADKLALIPYHREGRRVKGIVRFKIQHIANPYTNGEPLYRTGISVGDYPVDHHHKKNPLAPQHLDFYPVPSFTVPLGALLPADMAGLIAAEKAISVSNLANGTTRLQPCVLLTGQAAGTLAALSVQQGKTNAADVAVRLVQASLLQQGAYLMPYYDVPARHPQFEAVQRIGATGILRGTGKPNAWANQTWFYPDSLVRKDSLLIDLQPFTGKTISLNAGEFLTGNEALAIVKSIVLQNQVPGSSNMSNPTLRKKQLATLWKNWGFGLFNPNQPITRVQFAKLLDTVVNPFDLLGVNLHGQFQPKYSN